MNINALKVFCDAVRLHSFSSAGLENDISQSAVSQNIHNLEKSLGVKLVDCSTRPFELTREGKFFFNGCHGIVDRYQEIVGELKSGRVGN